MYPCSPCILQLRTDFLVLFLVFFCFLLSLFVLSLLFSFSPPLFSSPTSSTSLLLLIYIFFSQLYSFSFLSPYSFLLFNVTNFSYQFHFLYSITCTSIILKISRIILRVINWIHEHIISVYSLIYFPCLTWISFIVCTFFFAELRLHTKDGGPPNEGILMIYHQGEWGTSCNRGFDGNDAKVACRQLNLTSDYARYFTYLSFPNTDVPVWINNLACTGTERSILSCPGSHPSQRINCAADVSVRCPGKCSVGRKDTYYRTFTRTPTLSLWKN